MIFSLARHFRLRTASVGAVPQTIPAAPGLSGLVVRSQALLLPNGAIVGAEATHAVALTLGP